MTVEKYISVKYPLKASVWITRRKAAFVILTLGLIVLALNLHHFFYIVPVGFGKNSTVIHCSYKEDNKHFWFLKNIYRWIDGSIYCFIPIILLCVLNGLIIKQLILSKKQNSAMTNKNVLSSVQRKKKCCGKTNNIYAFSNNHNILYSNNANSNWFGGKFNKPKHGF